VENINGFVQIESQNHVVWWSKQRITIARALYKNPEVLLNMDYFLASPMESIVKRVSDDFKLQGKKPSSRYCLFEYH
jgi:ABC-type taurine transport system ATPase subunit